MVSFFVREASAGNCGPELFSLTKGIGDLHFFLGGIDRFIWFVCLPVQSIDFACLAILSFFGTRASVVLCRIYYNENFKR